MDPYHYDRSIGLTTTLRGLAHLETLVNPLTREARVVYTDARFPDIYYVVKFNDDAGAEDWSVTTFSGPYRNVRSGWPTLTLSPRPDLEAKAVLVLAGLAYLLAGVVQRKSD